MCYICHEEIVEDADRAVPLNLCACKGDACAAHDVCMSTWQTYSTRCGICKMDFVPQSTNALQGIQVPGFQLLIDLTTENEVEYLVEVEDQAEADTEESDAAIVQLSPISDTDFEYEVEE